MTGDIYVVDNDPAPDRGVPRRRHAQGDLGHQPDRGLLHDPPGREQRRLGLHRQLPEHQPDQPAHHQRLRPRRHLAVPVRRDRHRRRADPRLPRHRDRPEPGGLRPRRAATSGSRSSTATAPTCASFGTAGHRPRADRLGRPRAWRWTSTTAGPTSPTPRTARSRSSPSTGTAARHLHGARTRPGHVRRPARADVGSGPQRLRHGLHRRAGGGLQPRPGRSLRQMPEVPEPAPERRLQPARGRRDRPDQRPGLRGRHVQPPDPAVLRRPAPSRPSGATAAAAPGDAMDYPRGIAVDPQDRTRLAEQHPVGQHQALHSPTAASSASFGSQGADTGPVLLLARHPRGHRRPAVRPRLGQPAAQGDLEDRARPSGPRPAGPRR